jgi:uncharacterized membrane protein YfcA
MWRHYKRTFIPVQILAVGLSGVGYYWVGMPWPTVLIFFVMMQVFAVFGARWAERLQARTEADQKRRGKLSDLRL